MTLREVKISLSRHKKSPGDGRVFALTIRVPADCGKHMLCAGPAWDVIPAEYMRTETYPNGNAEEFIDVGALLDLFEDRRCSVCDPSVPMRFSMIGKV